MKQLITILALSLFTFSAQAQTVQLKGAPANFSKAKFKQLLHANGLSQQEYNQIGGMNAVINSLHKNNGQWKFHINNHQKAKLMQFTDGKIEFNMAEMGADEFDTTDIGMCE